MLAKDVPVRSGHASFKGADALSKQSDIKDLGAG